VRDKSTPGYLCPKYERCNAPFCPGGLGGSHLDGEPVCLYLREAVKPGGDARVRATLRRELADLVLTAARDLLPLHGGLSRALRDASRTESTIEGAKRLRPAVVVQVQVQAGAP
jgi:hypothetical protein